MTGAGGPDLIGRVALVTGAATGIGEACAVSLLAWGATVAIADVQLDAARETAARLGAGGATAEAFPVDVTNPGSVDALVAAVVARFGRLDVAVNNAGISGLVAPIHEYTTDAWRQVMAVDLDGVFYCTRAEIQHMREAGGGSIVNISSILGAVGTRNSPAYDAAKHGVVGLTKSAALEYAQENIRVNAVGPGRILTPMLASNLDEEGMAARAALAPMNRLGRPSEIGEAVAWLSSDSASFVTGAYLPVDGGFLAT